MKRISHLDNGDVSWLLDLFIGGPGDLKKGFKPYHMKGLQETQQQLIAEVPLGQHVLGELSRQLRVICAQDLFEHAVTEGIADVILSFQEAIRIKQ